MGDCNSLSFPVGLYCMLLSYTNVPMMDCSQTYEEYCSVQTPLWKPSARDSASRLPHRSWRSSIWNQCLLDALSCLVRYCNPLSFPVGFSCMPISYCYTNVPMIDCSQTYEEHCSAQNHVWILLARDSASRMPHRSRHPSIWNQYLLDALSLSCDRL